jgi:hypothetical protein
MIRSQQVALWGDGAASELRHGNHIAIQAGTNADSAAGLLIQSLQLTGLPGQYQPEGNVGVALRFVNSAGATVLNCDFTGCGCAIQDMGGASGAGAARVLNCRIHGWAAAALLLSGGEKIDSCTLTQDDPDAMGGHSGSGIVLGPACENVQISRSVIQNARAAAVELLGSPALVLTQSIDLAHLLVQACRQGIQIDSSETGATQVQDVTIEDCSIDGTYDGAAVSIKQGQGIQVRGNEIDGGAAGAALGLWQATEKPTPLSDVDVIGNSIRDCDRGIWAAAASGAFTRIDLSGNSLSNCRVPLDLTGVPGY